MSNDPRVLVLEELRKQTRLLGAIMLALNEKRTITPANAEATISDSVCDGQYGDPIVKAKPPRDWDGPDMKGRHFSECPAEYLDLLAERCDYFASKEEDQKKAGYERKDAARARAWAARKRNGWTAPASARVDETQTEPRW